MLYQYFPMASAIRIQTEGQTKKYAQIGVYNLKRIELIQKGGSFMNMSFELK